MTPLGVFVGTVAAFLLLLLLAGCHACPAHAAVGCPTFPTAAPRQ